MTDVSSTLLSTKSRVADERLHGLPVALPLWDTPLLVTPCWRVLWADARQDNGRLAVARSNSRTDAGVGRWWKGGIRTRVAGGRAGEIEEERSRRRRRRSVEQRLASKLEGVRGRSGRPHVFDGVGWAGGDLLDHPERKNTEKCLAPGTDEGRGGGDAGGKGQSTGRRRKM